MLNPNINSTKFQLSSIGVVLAALSPFVTNVDPNIAFAGVVLIIIMYMLANVLDKEM